MRHLEEFHTHGPLALGDLEQIPSFELLPRDYIEFMKKSNGGDGTVGDEHLIVFRAQEIVVINRAARVDEFAPGLLIFASDGGGQSYVFDLRSDPVTIGKIFDMDLGDEDPVRCADTFEGLLDYLAGVPSACPP